MYITLSYQNQRLLLNPQGGGIMAYYLEENGTRRDVIAGYDTSERISSMGDVLFPFPGRIEQAQYTFNGTTYQLSGLRVKDDGAVSHGFAKLADWRVSQVSPQQATLSFLLSEEAYGPKGYPFSLVLTLTYKLSDTGLTCTAEVMNTGRQAAPWGLGFHPYFTFSTPSLDTVAVQLPAQKYLESTNLKPTGVLLDVAGTPFDFRHSSPLGPRVLDTCFTDLASSNGRAETHLESNGKRITIWQDAAFPYLQVFSADTVAEPLHRKALAIEPQTCAGYAFNVPNLGLQVLEPGATFQGSWGVVAH